MKYKVSACSDVEGVSCPKESVAHLTGRFRILRVQTDFDLLDNERNEWVAPPPPASTKQLY